MYVYKYETSESIKSNFCLPIEILALLVIEW